VDRLPAGQEAKITVPVAYRLAKSAGTFRRLDLDTLDAICRALEVQPGELIEHVASQRPTTKRKRS